MKARLWPSTLMLLTLAVTTHVAHLWVSARQSQPTPYDYAAVLEGREIGASEAAFMAVRAYLPEAQGAQAEVGRLLVQAGMDNPDLRGEVDEVAARYSELVPTGAIWSAAVRGLVRDLDSPQAHYLTGADLQSMSRAARLPFNGIGALIEQAHNGIRVAAVLPGLPAEAAGIRAGDLITAVDGASAAHMSVYRGMELLRGAAGEPVRIELRRGHGLQSRCWEVQLERQPLHLESSVTSRMDSGEGHIAILWFDAGTPQRLQEALGELKAQGASRIHLDLSQTSAGPIRDGLAACETLVPAGSVLASYGGQELKSRCPQTFDLPMVVRVGEHTAGPAEFLAAALRAHSGARLVGQPTAGRGTDTNCHALPDGSALMLPGEEWLLPDGSHLEGRGLRPDLF